MNHRHLSRPLFSMHVDTALSWRGGQNQVWLTVQNLRTNGHRAMLIANPKGELYHRASNEGDLYPLVLRFEIDLFSAWRLSQLLRLHRPHVLHAHDAHAAAVSSIALSLSFTKHIRFIVSRRVDFRLGQTFLSRWKYHRVEKFICASDAIRQILINDGMQTAKTTVVHEGIDIDHIASTKPLDLHREFSIPPDTPIVGNVAALVSHKGQRYLLDAIALVIRKVPDARFLIVGTGNLETALMEQIQRLKLRHHVTLTGFRPDVISLIKGLDLFVMSSVMEGLGTSVLDAMACGCPVIGTCAGGIPESIVNEETGLLVPVQDADALATAIVRLLQDRSLRLNFGRAGLARAKSHFSSIRMVHETTGVYETLVDTVHARDTAYPDADVQNHTSPSSQDDKE